MHKRPVGTVGSGEDVWNRKLAAGIPTNWLNYSLNVLPSYGSVIHCSEFCFQGRKVLKTWGEVCRSPFSSQKWRDSKRTMSCWIIRPANPGHGSTTGIILWIWNAVKRSSRNQIKTKLCGVPSRAHNLQLSMNFDRVQREQKERVSGGVGGGRREILLLWSDRQQNFKRRYLEEISKTEL